MRREQIHKVCANHYITTDMSIKYREDDKDKKYLTWRALDFTDDEQRIEQFCCRYVTSRLDNPINSTKSS